MTGRLPRVVGASPFDDQGRINPERLIEILGSLSHRVGVLEIGLEEAKSRAVNPEPPLALQDQLGELQAQVGALEHSMTTVLGLAETLRQIAGQLTTSAELLELARQVQDQSVPHGVRSPEEPPIIHERLPDRPIPRGGVHVQLGGGPGEEPRPAAPRSEPMLPAQPAVPLGRSAAPSPSSAAWSGAGAVGVQPPPPLAPPGPAPASIPQPVFGSGPVSGPGEASGSRSGRASAPVECFGEEMARQIAEEYEAWISKSGAELNNSSVPDFVIWLKSKGFPINELEQDGRYCFLTCEGQPRSRCYILPLPRIALAPTFPNLKNFFELRLELPPGHARTFKLLRAAVWRDRTEGSPIPLPGTVSLGSLLLRASS